MSEKIELSTTQKIAFSAITEKQNQLGAQMQEIQRIAQDLQGQLVSISKEVFVGAGVDFEAIDNPVLADDKASITYDLKSAETIAAEKKAAEQAVKDAEKAATPDEAAPVKQKKAANA